MTRRGVERNERHADHREGDDHQDDAAGEVVPAGRPSSDATSICGLARPVVGSPSSARTAATATARASSREQQHRSEPTSLSDDHDTATTIRSVVWRGPRMSRLAGRNRVNRSRQCPTRPCWAALPSRCRSGDAILLVAAMWAFVAGATLAASAPVSVLGFWVNGAHACVLAVTAVLGSMACWRRRWLRRWSVAQSVGFFIAFAFRSALTVNTPDRYGFGLNAPDHALHATVAVLGFVVAMPASARLVEPPPGPLAYPDGRTDAPPVRSDR